MLDIDRITVKLLKSLRVSELASIKDSLLDIAEDGKITEDEIPELKEILDYLDSLSKTISELKTVGLRALHGGNGNGRAE